MGSPSLFAQTSDPSAAGMCVSPVKAELRSREGGQMHHLHPPRERVNWSELPPQRAASRDSLRNGALIGAAVGAAVLGGLAATIGHMQRERAAQLSA